MSYKTILVHLDGGKRRRQRLDLALKLAQRYGAHLIGLFGAAPLQPPISPEAAPVLIHDMVNERRRLVEQVKEEFLAKTREADYANRSAWRATLGDGFSALQLHAKYADLIVAGQPDPEDENGVPHSFAHDLVMSAGGPVLYVPFAGRFDDVGRRVLVAWNASREAARAVKDGLPFLQAAEAVDVVAFNPEDVFAGADDALPDPDMGSYLARHGIKAKVTTRPLGEVDIGSAILSYAADNAIDLIVMGAYSHSRLRELVLGGATRSLFESMTVPTLMAR